MKKTILAILLVAAIILSPAGRGADAGTPAGGKPKSKPALEQATFQLGHLNSTAHLLAFVAAEEGFFKEEGLDATLTLFASAGELAAGLTSGKLDAAFIGSVPIIAFQSQGQPLSIFGGAMTNGHGYVVKPKFVEGLTKDRIDITVLKGLRVATTKPSVQDLELQILLTKAGLTYGGLGEGKDVTVVYFDSQKDAYNAMAGAEIDAVSVYSPYASRAVKEGYKVIYYCSEVHEFENQPCCRQVAATKALTAKPNTYVAFERALIKAYKFSQENREKTISDVAEYIQIDRNLIETEVYGGYAKSVPDPDRRATRALKHSVVEFGYTADYNIEPLYETAIYKTALDSLLAEFPGDPVYTALRTRFEAAN
ncbi:MAG: ABC transporter substrate-binding protein [Oscillospiraceae bacterium]|jgi:NitT/TauT family transport system substrate-binding protein|nr:ABC transporter substrate-binding protein [Oscillospiraceae bacterium]